MYTYIHIYIDILYAHLHLDWLFLVSFPRSLRSLRREEFLADIVVLIYNIYMYNMEYIYVGLVLFGLISEGTAKYEARGVSRGSLC